jgi:transposase
VLVAIAREQLGLDALRSAVVLFFNRDRTRCKLLFHDGSGLVLLYKRLDQGRFQIPAAVLAGDRSVKIEPRELAVLLAGLERRRP